MLTTKIIDIWIIINVPYISHPVIILHHLSDTWDKGFESSFFYFRYRLIIWCIIQHSRFINLYRPYLWLFVSVLFTCLKFLLIVYDKISLSSTCPRVWMTASYTNFRRWTKGLRFYWWKTIWPDYTNLGSSFQCWCLVNSYWFLHEFINSLFIASFKIIWN